jgi:MarR family transcriptional regulator, negative regulator of the multidrug operon emrRAB
MRARAIVEDRCLALGDIVDKLSPSRQAQLESLAEILLRALTTSAAEADYICRLCDDLVCPPDSCPVHKTATALSEIT